MREVQEVRNLPGVRVVHADQCMFGLTTQGDKRGTVEHAKKATTFMTNSLHIANELNRTCDGSHKHRPLLGSNRAAAAQRSA